MRYAPDCHVEPVREWTAAGQRSSYEGHAGRRELAADWREAFERMDFIPQEIVDAGNPFIFLGHYRLRARGSGVEFDNPVGQILWVERGLVVRERAFADWDEALRVAGIPTAAAGSGRRARPAASRPQREG